MSSAKPSKNMPDPILSGGAPQQRAGIITPDQEIEIGTWSSSLSWKDRQRLRAIVRKVHLAHCRRARSPTPSATSSSTPGVRGPAGRHQEGTAERVQPMSLRLVEFPIS